MDAVLFQRIIDLGFHRSGKASQDFQLDFLTARFSGIGFSVSDS